MTERLVAFTESEFPRVTKAIRAVEAGIEHPFYAGIPAVGMEMLIGVTDAAITKGNSGTISVYSGTSSTLSDTSLNVTACARFGDVAIAKWVAMLPTAHGYEIIAAEC